MIRKLLVALALLLAVLALVLGVNASRLQPSPPADRAAAALAFDGEAAVRHLSAAIAIPTVSARRGEVDLAPFQALHALLAEAYPRLHAAIPREDVAEASLLYTWPGSDATCAPLVLLAHQDVVPVEPGTESQWREPPFSGAVREGYVWGRGTLDDKVSLIAILEAVEALLAEGFAPRCGVILGFGHDEEVGGTGAAAMAKRLKDRGVRPVMVLDEGGVITHDVMPVRAATVGVAEKGYLTVRLRVAATGGHSSLPPPQTAIGILAAAIAKLEQHRPSASLGPVDRALLARLAAYMPWSQRVVLGNLWLSAPLVKRMLATSPTTDALLRTTTAATVFDAGVKDNILPQQAEAVVNFRIKPGDSIAGVLAHVKSVIDDPRVEVAPSDQFGSEPTTPAPWDGPEFALIESSLRAVSDDNAFAVAPYVTNGATDARQFGILTDRLYRFVPIELDGADLSTVHGTNERVAVAEYQRAIRFYAELIRRHAG